MEFDGSSFKKQLLALYPDYVVGKEGNLSDAILESMADVATSAIELYHKQVQESKDQ